jgi:hypothetical protein
MRRFDPYANIPINQCIYTTVYVLASVAQPPLQDPTSVYLPTRPPI